MLYDPRIEKRTNRRSRIINLLAGMQRRFESDYGWKKGQYEGYNGYYEAVCLVGAIRRATDKQTERRAIYKALYDELPTRLVERMRRIEEHPEKVTHRNAVIFFNDHGGTDLVAVRDLIARALATKLKGSRNGKGTGAEDREAAEGMASRECRDVADLQHPSVREEPAHASASADNLVS